MTISIIKWLVYIVLYFQQAEQGGFDAVIPEKTTEDGASTSSPKRKPTGIIIYQPSSRVTARKGSWMYGKGVCGDMWGFEWGGVPGYVIFKIVRAYLYQGIIKQNRMTLLITTAHIESFLVGCGLWGCGCVCGGMGCVGVCGGWGVWVGVGVGCVCVCVCVFVCFSGIYREALDAKANLWMLHKHG